jgi:hypothetical protein
MEGRSDADTGRWSRRRHRSHAHDRAHSVVVAVSLIVVGAALLLDNLRIIEVGRWWNLWPLILVAWGAEIVLRESLTPAPRTPGNAPFEGEAR